MKKLLAEARVIVCVGSGGVGKTTTASSLGMAAAQMGRKVLVLTVDPAKRLKSTMGLSDESVQKITHPSIQGELCASVIDAKKTFDEFVVRTAGKSENTQKILQNKLYIQLSTTLSGSQEFTALEKLYSAYESNQYDLIVLDTPPTKHAIDFLEAPLKLSAVFRESVAKWFRDPSKGGSRLSGIFQFGTKQVLKVLENLTGSEFMSELASFFENIEKWQSELERRTSSVHRLLVSPETHFLLVTAFDEAKLKEAAYFSREIKKGGYHLSHVVVNRAFPFWLDELKVEDQNLNQSLRDLKNNYKNYFNQREKLFSGFTEQLGFQGNLVKLPDLPENISDLDGVLKLSRFLV